MQLSWSFPQLIVNPREGALPNVVIGINWICTASDDVNSVSDTGTVMLGNPNPAEFTPYDQITYTMAYNWVAEGISMEVVQNNVLAKLAALSAPVIQPQNPPF